MKINKERKKSNLTGVFLENFQSLRSPAYIKLNGITMLYGPNSAGKSSVLDALDFIHKLNNDDDNQYRTEFLWRKMCREQTRIGISYIGMPINIEDGVRQENFIKNEINNSFNHLDFIDGLVGKEVFIEYSNFGDTIKVAIEGRPFFEINGFFQSILYNEDYGLAIEDDDIYNADECEREIHGRFIAYMDNPLYKKLLPELIIFRNDVAKKNADLSEVGKDEKLSSISKILKLIIEDDEEKFSIRGIELRDDWDSYHRRFSVITDYKLDNILRGEDIKPKSTLLDLKTKAQFFRYNLRDEIFELSRIINGVLEGLRFQICKAIKHSKVSGSRGIIDSDTPVYATNWFGSLQLKNHYASVNHIIDYARSRSEDFPLNPIDSMGMDFPNLALKKYMTSLSGYKINESVHISKPKNKNKSRYTQWNDFEDNEIVFLNVEDKSGRILGFQEVGSGLSYVLPVFTSLWASTLSFVEQPELHLHPAAQCELADVFIAAKNLGSHSVVESHSEHLLLRILRRIRETNAGKLKDKILNLSCNDIRIYYFNPSPLEGTTVFEIRVDHFGELLNRWPGGFFSERDQELFT